MSFTLVLVLLDPQVLWEWHEGIRWVLHTQRFVLQLRHANLRKPLVHRRFASKSAHPLLWTVSWSPLGRGWRLYLRMFSSIWACFWGGKLGKKSALSGEGYTISGSQGYLLCSHSLKDNLRWAKHQENCFSTKYNEQLSELKIVNSGC